MDNSFDQHSIETKQKPGFLGGLLQKAYSIKSWLVAFLWLTEDDKEEAGIFLGYRG